VVEAAKRFNAQGFRLGLRLQQELKQPFYKEGRNMLWTICVILLVLWALGLVTSYTMGGMIHLLLVIALIVVIIRLMQGRRVV
jgi:hypothetical protein